MRIHDLSESEKRQRGSQNQRYVDMTENESTAACIHEHNPWAFEHTISDVLV